jgi:glycosyltransferase involved in cell wall biosynthesis
MYETWGLSTNEAMCFGLPVILSDMVGCSYDLIKNNGFMFHSGDYKMLAKQIDLIFSLPENEYQKMRQNSSEIISYYNYENIIKGIKEAAFKETLKPVKVNQFERLFF